MSLYYRAGFNVQLSTVLDDDQAAEDIDVVSRPVHDIARIDICIRDGNRRTVFDVFVRCVEVTSGIKRRPSESPVTTTKRSDVVNRRVEGIVRIRSAVHREGRRIGSRARIHGTAWARRTLNTPNHRILHDVAVGHEVVNDGSLVLKTRVYKLCRVVARAEAVPQVVRQAQITRLKTLTRVQRLRTRVVDVLDRQGIPTRGGVVVRKDRVVVEAARVVTEHEHLGAVAVGRVVRAATDVGRVVDVGLGKGLRVLIATGTVLLGRSTRCIRALNHEPELTFTAVALIPVHGIVRVEGRDEVLQVDVAAEELDAVITRRI